MLSPTSPGPSHDTGPHHVIDKSAQLQPPPPPPSDRGRDADGEPLVHAREDLDEQSIFLSLSSQAAVTWSHASLI
jgi:hypothetical protein